VTSAEDAARWLRLQLSSQPAVAATHAVQIPLPEGISPHPEMTFTGYGLGWVVGTYRGRPLQWHNGGVDGFLTYTLLLPEQGIGVTASANLHSSGLSEAVAFEVADALLGASGGGWFDRLHPSAQQDAAAEGTPPPQRSAAEVAPPSHPLDAFAAVYVDDGYGELVVEVRDGRLHVRLGDTDLVATHRHYDTWDLRYDVLDVDLPLTFVTDADGVVAEVVVPLEPTTAPTRFQRGAS
jgi:hypothetical protein